MNGGSKKRRGQMTFESIVGQARPVRFLTQILQKKRVPNALLFTGIDGIGKQMTARAFGMVLNCAKPDGVKACKACPSCGKVMTGSHPDIIPVEPEGAFIKIDQIRAVARQLRFAPLEGKWRIVIINDAQAMNLEASNALLKMLEEPPPGTVLILTATQTTDLLPTIVSRCQQIAFRPIPYEKVAEMLEEQEGLDRETATTLALCTKGSLGKALSVDIETWSAWRTELLGEIAKLSLDSVQPILTFAESLSRDKNRLADGIDMIMTWYRDVLMSRIAPERIINKDFIDRIELSGKGRQVNELVEQVQIVNEIQTTISQNANPRLALEVMMFRLCSESQPHR
jgi:DNA polymerase-3 subunit delta'